jgi:hypothetical protein
MMMNHPRPLQSWEKRLIDWFARVELRYETVFQCLTLAAFMALMVGLAGEVGHHLLVPYGRLIGLTLAMYTASTSISNAVNPHPSR